MPKDQIFIGPTATLVEALKQLDKAATKVLFVVDDQRRLLGTISDGDIRRYILERGSLEGTVQEAMNPDPVAVLQEDIPSHTVLQELFIQRFLTALPVLDRERRVVDWIIWKEVFSEEEHPAIQSTALEDVPVVIMAGGKGTRLDPFTRVLPKPLIPVGEKTILEHIIERFRRYGAQRFYLTVNYRAEMIEAYFRGIAKPYQVHFIREPEYLGTAGSLALLTDHITVPFFVTNCDILLDIDFAEAYQFHLENQSLFTSIVAIQHYRVPYGVVTMTNGGQIEKITEKPEYTFPINTGVYILSPEVFSYIPSGQPFDMPHLIQRLMETHQSIYAYPIPSSAYIDVGQWTEYRKAVEKLKM